MAKKKRNRPKLTVLERFRKLEETKPSLSNRDLIGFLEDMDERFLLHMDVDYWAKMGPECLEFSRYFFQRYGDRSRLMDHIENGWDDEPLVFACGMDYEEALDETRSIWKLSERQKRNCQRLCQYILGLREDITVAYTTSDNSIDYLYFDYPSDDPQAAMDCLSFEVDLLTRREGNLYVERWLPGKDRMTITGFQFFDGEVAHMDAELLKEAFARMPEKERPELLPVRVHFDHCLGPVPVNGSLPAKAGDSILVRFLKLEKRDPEMHMTSLKEFLVTENAKIIGRLDLGEDFEDVMAECASFTDYLTEKYCRTDEFLDRLDKVFPKPLTIWELGTQYEDYMLDRNPGPELTPREEENCRRLVDYVVHIPGNRVLTVIRGVNTITSDQYSIIDVEGEENEKGLRKELTRLFTNLARRGDASLILRYSSPSPGVDIINGFRFKAHFIQKVPQAELKWAMETQPDGSRMEFPDQIYQQAFVSFT